MSKLSASSDLNVCYSTVAKIVRDYGETYLPIFNRLHEVKLRLEADLALRTIALQVAANSAE